MDRLELLLSEIMAAVSGGHEGIKIEKDHHGGRPQEI
jgi:hypothetical protein